MGVCRRSVGCAPGCHGAASGVAGLPVVLIRRMMGRRVEDLAALLIAHLPGVDSDRYAGSIVVFGMSAPDPSAAHTCVRYAGMWALLCYVHPNW